MEGLAAASGVIAVVGLAGQVAQGCAYLLDVFDGIKSTPEELRLLIHELRVIQDLVRATASSPIATQDERPLHDALDFCDECIGKLTRLVERYGEPVRDGSRQTWTRKWGSRLSMALSKDKIRKHVERLRAAQGHLRDSRNLHIQKSEVAHSKTVIRSIESLKALHSSSATVISSIEGTVGEVRDSTEATRNTMHQLVESIANVPMMVTNTLEHALRDLLAEHVNKQTNKRSEEIEPGNIRYVEPSRPKDVKAGPALQMHPQVSQQNLAWSCKTPIQKSHHSSFIQVYHTWFGTIRFQSSVFTASDSQRGGLDAYDQSTTITRTHVTIFPRPRFLRWAAMLEYERRDKLWLSSSNITYYYLNKRPNDSKLFCACRMGNLKELRQMFVDRIASPFDVNEDGRSLLDIAFNNFTMLLHRERLSLNFYYMKRFSPRKQWMSLVEQHASQLADTIAYLIDCGLDPGMIGCSFSGPSVHSQPALSQLLDLATIPFENTEVEKHLLSRLTRLLIENARTDPFVDGVVPERVLVALSVIWRDSGYLVANGILSQDTWLVDYNAVLENSNEKLNENSSGLHSHLLSLLDAPYLNADAKPDEVDHEARRCQEECTALSLLLAAGLDAKWFTEPNLSSAPTSYSGHILHTAMRKACDAWSHAVAKSSKNVTGRITTQVVCNFCSYPELTRIRPLLGNLMQSKRSSIDSLKSKCDRAMAFKRNIRDAALNSDSCKSWLAELKQNAVFRGHGHSAKFPIARYSTLSGDEETVDPLAYLRKRELLRLFCIIANKLLDTLIACLKHGVNPRSRNTQGVSATMFARHCHILQLWEVSLDITGFDLATIDELFVSDTQMALAENNYRIAIDPAYLSIIYDRIWIYHCWRGVVKLMGGGRTLFSPIENIVAILEGINKAEKGEGERTKTSGLKTKVDSIADSQSSNNPDYNRQMQLVLTPQRVKRSGQPPSVHTSSLERFPIRLGGIYVCDNSPWCHPKSCYTLQINSNVAESKRGTKDSPSYVAVITPSLPDSIPLAPSNCRMDDQPRCRGDSGLLVPSVLPGLPGQFPIDEYS